MNVSMMVLFAIKIHKMYARCMQHDSCDAGSGHVKIMLGSVSFHFVKFEMDEQNHRQVTVCKQNFKMADILFFQMEPTLKATYPK